jgi:hypothetical protein
MKIRYWGIGGLLAATASSAVTAGAFSEDLNRCAVNAATAADRIALTRWAFTIAAANPAFADMATVNEARRQQNFRAAAGVFDRILIHDCRRESLAALRNEGRGALENGFAAIGELAGREMVSSPVSLASAEQLSNFVDIAGFEALAREAGVAAPAHPATTP